MNGGAKPLCDRAVNATERGTARDFPRKRTDVAWTFFERVCGNAAFWLDWTNMQWLSLQALTHVINRLVVIGLGKTFRIEIESHVVDHDGGETLT